MHIAGNFHWVKRLFILWFSWVKIFVCWLGLTSRYCHGHLHPILSSHLRGYSERELLAIAVVNISLSWRRFRRCNPPRNSSTNIANGERNVYWHTVYIAKFIQRNLYLATLIQQVKMLDLVGIRVVKFKIANYTSCFITSFALTSCLIFQFL